MATAGSGSGFAGVLAGPLERTSDNVEFVDNIPLEATATGAQLVKSYLYVSSSRGLHIFDVKDPAAPVLVGEYSIVHDPVYPQEDPATDGNLLLLAVQSLTMLNRTVLVLDVRDKENPHLIGELTPAPNDLTLTCILDCRWAYGSTGAIIDLRDPTDPKFVGDWRTGDRSGGGHSISEVARGRVIVDGGRGPLLMDVRRNPEEPRTIADSHSAPFNAGFHSIDWPARMKATHVIAGEGSINNCAVATYDVSKWLTTGQISKKDSFSLGRAEASGHPTTFDCPHWFDAEPDYSRGGLIVAPWHQKGVRFLRVSPTGRMTDVGYFQPVNSDSWTTLWGSGDYIYSIDYVRGLDILRLKR